MQEQRIAHGSTSGAGHAYRPASAGAAAPMMGSSRPSEGECRVRQAPAKALHAACNDTQTTADVAADEPREHECTGASREQVAPEPRTRRNCKCGGPCFYCHRPLTVRHEHDHFPIPWRHGGRDTVPACYACHTEKDRALYAQSNADLIAEGTSRRGMFAQAAILAALKDRRTVYDMPRTERGDWMLELMGECSNAPARIVMARILTLAVDRDERSLGGWSSDNA